MILLSVNKWVPITLLFTKLFKVSDGLIIAESDFKECVIIEVESVAGTLIVYFLHEINTKQLIVTINKCFALFFIVFEF